MKNKTIYGIVAGAAGMAASLATQVRAGTFAEELEFLKKNTEVIVLRQGDRLVAVSPKLQGRVFMSTFGDPGAPALGWVNRPAVETGESQTAAFNNFGGAERFWLGPEAGQFALYFKPGAKQEIANWFVPKAFDTGEFKVFKSDEDYGVLMGLEKVEVTNASGTHFTLAIARNILLMKQSQVEDVTGPVGDLKWVAFESTNKLRNDGANAWTPETGTVGVWLLGMFTGTPATWVVVPYRTSGSGPIVKDDYFGKVPSERLRPVKDKPVLLFKADGRQRTKIGISPHRSLEIAGSIDFDRNIVTIVKYDLPIGGDKRYVNNTWEVPQADPYGGDVIQSYNDGESGFYELETSSPAAFLKPGDVLEHTSRTIHLHGPPEKLDPIVQRVFRATWAELKATAGE